MSRPQSITASASSKSGNPIAFRRFGPAKLNNSFARTLGGERYVVAAYSPPYLVKYQGEGESRKGVRVPLAMVTQVTATGDIIPEVIDIKEGNHDPAEGIPAHLSILPHDGARAHLELTGAVMEIDKGKHIFSAEGDLIPHSYQAVAQVGMSAKFETLGIPREDGRMEYAVKELDRKHMLLPCLGLEKGVSRAAKDLIRNNAEVEDFASAARSMLEIYPKPYRGQTGPQGILRTKAAHFLKQLDESVVRPFALPAFYGQLANGAEMPGDEVLQDGTALRRLDMPVYLGRRSMFSQVREDWMEKFNDEAVIEEMLQAYVARMWAGIGKQFVQILLAVPWTLVDMKFDGWAEWHSHLDNRYHERQKMDVEDMAAKAKAAVSLRNPPDQEMVDTVAEVITEALASSVVEKEEPVETFAE